MKLRELLLEDEDTSIEHAASSDDTSATSDDTSTTSDDTSSTIVDDSEVSSDKEDDEVKLDSSLRKVLGNDLEELVTLMISNGVKTKEQIDQLVSNNTKQRKGTVDTNSIEKQLLNDLYQWADNKDNTSKVLLVGSKYSGTNNKIIQRFMQDKVLMALRTAMVSGFNLRGQGVTFIGMFANIAIATSFSVEEDGDVIRIIIPNRDIQSIMNVLYTKEMGEKSSKSKESLVKILMISLNKGDVQPNKVESDLPKYIDSIFNGDDEEFRLKAWVFMSDPYKKQGYGMSGSISFGSPIGDIESTRNPYAQQIKNKLNDGEGKTRICDLPTNLMKALFKSFEKNVTMLKKVLAEKDEEWDGQSITAPISIRKLYFQKNQSIKTLLYKLQILLTIVKKHGYPINSQELKNFVSFFQQFLDSILRIELPNSIDSNEECGKIIERFIQTYRDKNKAMFVNLNRVVSIKDKRVHWAMYKSKVS